MKGNLRTSNYASGEEKPSRESRGGRETCRGFFAQIVRIHGFLPALRRKSHARYGAVGDFAGDAGAWERGISAR